MVEPHSQHTQFVAWLHREWIARKTTDAETCALYLIGWCWLLHGRRGISRLTREVPAFHNETWERLLSSKTRPTDCAQLLATCRLRGIRSHSVQLLLRWLRCDLPLFAVTNVPTAEEMLSYLACGKRPVTLIFEPEQLHRNYEHHESALEFLVHDLEHAARFLESQSMHRRQTEFFKVLLYLDRQGVMSDLLVQKDLIHRWKYLISDMNTDPHHGLAYLHSIMKEGLIQTGMSSALTPQSPSTTR